MSSFLCNKGYASFQSYFSDADEDILDIYRCKLKCTNLVNINNDLVTINLVTPWVDSKQFSCTLLFLYNLPILVISNFKFIL